MAGSNFETKCPTGIPGFDVLCQGGLVRDSVNVVLGGPGAGKSTFLLQFLWHGFNDFKENGLFISFEPDIEEIFKDGQNYGWDFASLDNKGKCKFIKVSPKINIRILKQELMRSISQFDIKRICIDPISILLMSIKNEALSREYVFDVTSLLKRLSVTVLISDETHDGNIEEYSLGAGESQTESIKFMSDGLVNLYSSGIGGETDRALRITKMRRTDHVRGPVPFKITNKGIVVYSKR